MKKVADFAKTAQAETEVMVTRVLNLIVFSLDIFGHSLITNENEAEPFTKGLDREPQGVGGSGKASAPPASVLRP
jgi:hypothetical protein